MLSALLGLLTIAVGFWGLFIWRSEFVLFLKGIVPSSLVFAGLVALIAGLGNRKKSG